MTWSATYNTTRYQRSRFEKTAQSSSTSAPSPVKKRRSVEYSCAPPSHACACESYLRGGVVRSAPRGWRPRSDAAKIRRVPFRRRRFVRVVVGVRMPRVRVCVVVPFVRRGAPDALGDHRAGLLRAKDFDGHDESREVEDGGVGDVREDAPERVEVLLDVGGDAAAAVARQVPEARAPVFFRTSASRPRRRLQGISRKRPRRRRGFRSEDDPAPRDRTCPRRRPRARPTCRRSLPRRRRRRST